MPLTSGTRLGPYEILAAIGAGGMGEVYQARDPRLGRDVALKVSTQRFSERFEREARAIAALNHPNICTLYDVGPDYLVMELVEGPTLAERIAQGPLPLEEALDIARQIADALEAAHERNIVHRDLKPGNVKLKPDGTVRVLDFGLAKVGGAALMQSDDSPTLTIGPTQAGMILGTTAYMAPEQAKGKPVDKRADIWAFGVLVYEMLTGRKLFSGETTTEVLAAVIEREPDWQRVPAKVRPLLRRCLVKDPKRRLRDIADALPLLDLAPETQPAGATKRRYPWLWPAVAALVLVTLAPIAILHFRESPPAAQPVRFQIPFTVTPAPNGVMELSPDGRHLAFTGTGPDGAPHLWIRDLDSLETRVLAGAVVSIGPAPYFWSFDSRSLVYQATRGERINRIDIAGGPPQVLCDDAASNLVGGGWNREGVIIFGSDTGPIMRVPAGGGTPTPITALDPSRKETLHSFPSFLPDGRHFIYVRRSSVDAQSGLYVGTLDAKPGEQSTKRILAITYGAVFVPSPGSGPGQLLFLRESTLMTVGFNASKFELVGDPVAVAEHLGSFRDYGYFTASSNGVLIYRTGSANMIQLNWLDRQGKLVNPAGDVLAIVVGNMSLSPDGKRLAENHVEGGNTDIYIHEFDRGRITRFTFDPAEDTNPVWSPDGTRIAFASTRNGRRSLYIKSSNLSGEEQLLFQADEPLTPTSWSHDGAYLLFNRTNSKTLSDMWALPLEGKREPFLVYSSPANDGLGQFSPDSRWIAYVSQESGSPQIWVRPFVPPGRTGAADASAKWQVSTGGGTRVRWRQDGKELLFQDLGGRIFGVEVTANPIFQPGVPKPLLTVAVRGNWDVTADGQRFLVPGPAGQTPGDTPQFNVILNWQAALKK